MRTLLRFILILLAGRWLWEWLREWHGRGEHWQPPRPPPAPQADEVPFDQLDLRDDPAVLSPPIVDEPLYQCATAVTVRGFVPHADLDVEVGGAIVTSVAAGFPEPVGETVPLPNPLTAGDGVRARQRVSGVTSGWSIPVTVRSHLVDYPAGPPRPQVNPAPPHECGARTGVSNLLIGCNVWITADGTEVGRVNGAAAHQGVNVNPDYGLGQQVVAFAELCRDPSPPSQTHVTQPPPSPLPTPAFEPLYQGGEQVTITSLANGARFRLARNGTDLGERRTWGQRHYVGIAPPFVTGDVFEASQRLCPGVPSGTGTTTVQPCSALPAPVVAPIQVGDTRIQLLSFVPDARIKVWASGTKVGDGAGAVIQLTRPIGWGETVYVRQVLGTCAGATVREVHPHCVAPPVAVDPSALDLFPVGQTTYDGGATTLLGFAVTVKGTVYYPADSDGVDTPFHARLGGLGPVPIVFMAHGNHARFREPDDPNVESCSGGGGLVEIPNHEGYDYFQRALARMGIIAVSVYSNETNCVGLSVTNIRLRAELIIASIAHFQGLGGGHPIFGGRVDFSRTGLMGHSRGGEAVVVVPEAALPAGVTIRAVVSLAPTDSGASSGAPAGHAFLTILPAGDGDVVNTPGAKYYDRATPSPVKCQLYVHHANHNFFNRQWPKDESLGPPVMSRAAHERVLASYGCALFRSVLLGHDTLGYLSGRLLPAGVATANVHLSFERSGQITVDHHEDMNGIGTNSLGAPTAQSGGLVADEHPFRHGAPGAFNGSFFGNTTGMVARSKERGTGVFRSSLPAPADVTGREIWVRAAEVYDGSSVPAGATGFELGLEDGAGSILWVDVDEVGGLPRPYDRRADDLAELGIDLTKTMLKTFRFPIGCYGRERGAFEPHRLVAILVRLNRSDQRAIALDVLQTVGS